MNENNSNDLQTIITQVIEEMKSEQGHKLVLCQEKVQIKCVRFPYCNKLFQLARAMVLSVIFERYSASYCFGERYPQWL